MVRVLIDASALPADRGGVGRYVDEIVSWLPKLGVDCLVVSQPRDWDAYAAAVGTNRVHVVPGWASHRAARLAWEQTGLPLLVRRLRPDVVHSPHYTLPIITSVPRNPKLVVTVHDATFFSDPDLHTGVKARFFREWTRVAARRADALIAPSQATKSEVLGRTGVDSERITVVPHGVDHRRFRPASAAAVEALREWLGLPSGVTYVAFLGTLEPRKNVPALIRAFVAATEHLDLPPALVLAGGRGWDDGIEPALAEVPERVTVLRPGFVPDPLVPALLSGAEIVAYPAFGEGFGLPVLEAMACGAAVLTTRRLSLPEVGGNAVCYAASPSHRDLADALTRLLGDSVERERLGRAGIERAAAYTWEATAQGHVAVYERVCSGA